MVDLLDVTARLVVDSDWPAPMRLRRHGRRQTAPLVALLEPSISPVQHLAREWTDVLVRVEAALRYA